MAYGMPATDARGARTRAAFIASGAAPLDDEDDEALWRARILWNPMPALEATRIAMLRDEPRPLLLPSLDDAVVPTEALLSPVASRDGVSTPPPLLAFSSASAAAAAADSARPTTDDGCSLATRLLLPPRRIWPTRLDRRHMPAYLRV